jgi:gliding motility associated protien GldN
MKKIFFILLVILLGSTSTIVLKAQVIDGAYNKRITLDRKPAPLPEVREADALWSKTVWRIIDLREKANQHLYYPTREIQKRSNLINLLLKGLKEGTITSYDAAQDDDEFKLPMTFDQVKQQFGASTKVTQRRNFETGEMEDVTIQQDMRPEEVKQLMVKEIWYFDKQTSTLQVRILGLCPIRLYYRDEDVTQENVLRKKIFWVYYPEVRTLLAKYESLNTANGARSFSFDDIFLTRRFDGYIVKEENIYNNRSIEQYGSGEYAAKESDRIKTSIFNFEQDLWEY